MAAFQVPQAKKTVDRCLLRRHNQQVYFSNPQSGECYYFASTIDNEPVEYSVQVTFNGNPVCLSKLDDNTEATLTIDKYVIVKVDFTLLRPLRSSHEIYGEGHAISEPKICDRCQNAISEAVLICGHGVCKGCFFERIAELRREKEYVVEPSGEVIREFTCPILDCQDLDPLPLKVLQQLLGDQFDAYLEEAKRVRMMRKCTRCGKVYEATKFLLSSCMCKICVYCQLELVNSNYGMCICGVPFDALANTTAQTLTETCQQCRRTLLLWKDFTPVRCSEHVLCINCLEKALKDEKHQMRVESRCPSCNRPFAPYEIQLAQPCFVRMCDLFCGQFFDSSGALDLPCGCHYCEKCAVQCAKNYGISNCYNCREPFPQQLIAALTRKMKVNEFLSPIRLPRYQATKCEICMKMIGVVQRFVLACIHTYHRNCINEYLSNYVSTAVKEEIMCPKPSCRVVIPPNLLQQVADPKDFEKYELLLIKTNDEIVACPTCGNQMYGGSMDLGVNAQVLCSFCGNPFCAKCEQPWQEPHDAKKCKVVYVQQLIVMLQVRQAAGEGSQIAQCPGCKIPCLKDDNCTRLRCPNIDCRTEWCFKCSCFRAPTVHHSNSWHRPQCRFWAPSDGSEKAEGECPECQRCGVLCKPPPNLKVMQRFDIDEY